MPSITVPDVPAVRVQALNSIPVHSNNDFVLYWMTAYRRTRFNFALQRAVVWAEKLRKPLVILEAVRCNYRWASDRLHQFILDGMLDNAQTVPSTNALYCAYIEPSVGDGHGLVESLASHSCIVVTDDFPCFFYPALYQRLAKHWRSCMELVDSNTIVPMRSIDRTFTVAHSYRRYMQKELVKAWPEFPVENPLAGLTTKRLSKLPESITSGWNVGVGTKANAFIKSVVRSALPIDHSVAPVLERGGEIEGGKVVERFLTQRLSNYGIDRNEPEKAGSSGLSPYLHFGHVSSHEVFQRLVQSLQWAQHKLGKPNGKMQGFWNMDENAEAFMDQLMTWREIGFNMCWRERNFDRFESLPEWAQKTLAEHEHDPRPWLYELNQLEQATTHDPLWNAAQRQLVREGRMHNYLRMLWGKKILQWTRSPREALRIMLELNNKYALDGRDPNSYSGIFWVLGRYDRAWGPERPVFGKIRYMTSESTQNKFHVKKYIEQYSQPGE
jgi:deoxyribodipyrimidine photo-lyase